MYRRNAQKGVLQRMLAAAISQVPFVKIREKLKRKQRKRKNGEEGYKLKLTLKVGRGPESCALGQN